ncbi:DUF2254 domain-containing protein [Alphaproteobacteria bacterium GH1-50]|uniref:DUF2254 domain-containing protein n=1 Tax=Kangsaoukella pontilimi TaxID=2691042 RepID=A0A7C9IG66_9RHOB|nr:DUF2254 domain-containing protein [Kangsaoukella pontilimi]MXQ08108.1 DUF2254 domain-containing protein [Kangsaoukella pontilimi]
MGRLRRLILFFRRYYRNMGLRVVLYALSSLLAAFLGPLGAAWINDLLDIEMTFSSVLPVLTILASSMLAVSTFSLNIMVAAHRAAANATTPRVHRILLEDTTTQSVLAAFIGAFVYSLSSIILYRAGFYREEAALLVMGLTILVVLGVVFSLLRWISHLTTLGSVDESLRVAQARAEETLTEIARHPRHGARPLSDLTDWPDDAVKIPAPSSGFVQLVDIGQLHECIGASERLRIDVRAGMHVLEGAPVAEVTGSPSDDLVSSLSDAFTIGDTRSQDQDAEFGLTVLAESASRALSPGINDPGTAIQALCLLKSLLWHYARTEPDEDAELSDRVFAGFADPEHLVDAAFRSIARDGAGTIEVAKHLRRALAELAKCGDPSLEAAVRDMADLAMAYSKSAGLLDQELEELREINV